MIITIDGPAGAGKSCAARALAQRLGYRFLDTGAMYRAVTLAAKRQGIDMSDPDAMEKVAQQIDLKLDEDRVLLNGEDVTKEIRSFDITTSTRYAADSKGVRAQLVCWQRDIAQGQNVVSEGRDQSTVVFPEAECKIFLTASEEVRAERRYLDLISRGEQVTRAEVLAKQQLRDSQDCSREVGSLIQSEDAIEFSTDGLAPEEVVDQLLRIVESRRAAISTQSSNSVEN